MRTIHRRTLLATTVLTLTSTTQLLRTHASVDESSLAARRPSTPNTTISLATYCVGDGSTNDAAGLVRALSELERRGGGTLRIPERSYMIRPRGWIAVPKNCAIVGEGPGARLLLASDSEKNFTMLFRCNEPGVRFENVELERVSNVFGSFFGVFTEDVWLHNIRMQGNLSKWNNDFNGMRAAGDGNPVARLTVSQTTISDCGYGIYLSESDRQVAEDILVDRFTGKGNHCDDLEFCAPLGTLRNVTVQRSSFTDNRATWSGAGFAIGLANVQGAHIENCTFHNYGSNPIHIERDTRNVRIASNKFTASSVRETGAGYAAPIIILSGSREIEIVDNSFDLSGQDNEVNCIYVGPGGAREVSPTNIRVIRNEAKMRSGQQLMVNYGSGSVSLGENLLAS